MLEPMIGATLIMVIPRLLTPPVLTLSRRLVKTLEPLTAMEFVRIRSSFALELLFRIATAVFPPVLRHPEVVRLINGRKVADLMTAIPLPDLDPSVFEDAPSLSEFLL